ncbi:MAG: NAD(P)-binding domain-containing protein [Clostridia bacterium]|nr:NAD(P)-binding domain-containing protein [Clostridia bacterium]
MNGFIGFGNLAGSVVAGFLDKKVIKPGDFAVFDKSDAAISKANSLGIRVYTDLAAMVYDCDRIFLAVKPWVFAELLEGFDRDLFKGKTVVSFMACYPLEKLESDVPAERIVRIIPTIAIKFGEDTIALASNHENVSDIIELFENLGQVHHVSEDMLDRIMIGASSGLGFAAEMLDMYEKALCSMGLSRELAHDITAATFRNAARFEDFADLASRVATKGGVTEKGLWVMREENMAKTVEKAIKTAENVIK